MKLLKTIVIMIFCVQVAQFAVAQNHNDMVFPSEKANEIKSVQLYPNPAVEYLVVRFAEPCAQKVKLAVHSIIGNTVEVEREIIDDHEIRLHVKDLPSGYYFLALKDEEASQRGSFKFLKR
ncbi:MAG TPA: T9SS type A sorting domain-containing protein [Cyclobacteriaceae bacterium]|jgi:hypothetical protein|nr:T9SS type A sorting domain-containing protein [Cyclobacteriaceae bacterium]